MTTVQPLRRLAALVALCTFFCVFIAQAKPLLTALNNDTIYLSADRVTASGVGATVDVPIRVSNFTDVGRVELSMVWNYGLLRLDAVQNLNLSGLSNTNFNLSQSSNGVISLTWHNPALVTHANGTAIFSLRFTILAATGTDVAVSFADAPTPIMLESGSLAATARVRVTSGAVRVQNAIASPSAGLTCQNATWLCHRQLNGYFGTLINVANTQTNPGSSVSCGNVQNNSWLSFTAETPNITLRFRPFNCNGGLNLSGDGLQVAIFKSIDCQAFEPYGCRFQIAPTQTNGDTLQLRELVAGQRFYIMLDGYAADVCDFVITVEEGRASDGYTPPTTINGSATLCPNQTARFSVPTVAGAQNYIWQLPNGVTPLSNLSGQPFIDVRWGNSQGNISLKIVGQCDTSAPINKTISIGTATETNLNAQFCEGGSYTFGSRTLTSAGIFRDTLRSSGGCDSIVILNLSQYPTPSRTLDTAVCVGACVVLGGQPYCSVGSHRVVLRGASQFGCDSIVNLQIRNFPTASFSFDTILCENTCLTIGSRRLCDAGTHNVILSNASQNHCDSTVSVNISFLNITAIATASNQLTCENQTVTLSATNSTASLPNTDLTFEWKNANNETIGRNTTQNITTAGTYTLIVTARNRNVSCQKTTTITVTQTGNFPNQPEMAGRTEVCRNQQNTYTISTPQTGVTRYSWQIPLGAQIASANADSTSISINWTNIVTNNGFVRVRAVNGCGQSNEAFLQVQVRNAPDSVRVTAPNAVCPNSEGILRALDTAGVTTFTWDVLSGGATLRTTAGLHQATFGFLTQNAQIRMTPSNACGAGRPTFATVAVRNTQPDSLPIVGRDTVCQNAQNIIFSTDNLSGLTYRWTSTNATFSTPINTPSVTANFGTQNNAQICVALTNSCNLTRTICKNILIRNTQPDSIPIAGRDTVCANETNVRFRLATPLPLQFTWSASGGATLAGANNENSANFNFNQQSNAQICVAIQNDCGVSRSICKNIVIKNQLPDSVAIVGTTRICPNGTATYSFTLPNVANNQLTNIVWQVPTGATLISGQNSRQISVNWGNSAGGNVTAVLTNACGLNRTLTTNVIVSGSIDSLPIISNNSVCSDSLISFSVSGETGINYTWTIENGTFEGNPNGATVQARFSAPSGGVTVTPNSGCASGRLSRRTVVVTTPPNQPSAIIGATNVLVGSTENYQIAAVAGATRYEWRLPSGTARVSEGATPPSVSVRFLTGSGGNLCVRALNDCGASAWQCLTISSLRRPTANAGASDTICGRTTQLAAVPSIGNGEWTKISGNGNILFDNATNFDATVTASQAGVYVLQWKETNQTLSDSARITLTFSDAPQMRLLTNDCAANARTFQTRVGISGSDAPFSVSGLSGSVSGNEFRSDDILSGSRFAVVARNAVGCVSDTLSGRRACDCISASGQVSAVQAVACSGDAVRVRVSSQRLDADDIGEFILHDGNSTIIGNILARNRNGVFSFDASVMSYNRNYFVSHLVGDSSANNRVNMADACLSRSVGVAVRFKASFTVSLLGDTTICRGDQAILRLNTNTSETITGSFSNNFNQNFNFTNISNGRTFQVSPTVTGTRYTLNRAIDADGCAATVQQSAVIQLRNLPTAQGANDASACGAQTILWAQLPPPQYVGVWRSLSGQLLSDSITLIVNNLGSGSNQYIWEVRDAICPREVARDTTLVSVPIKPEAVSLALITEAGQEVTGSITPSNVLPHEWRFTRLNDPHRGRLTMYSQGGFSYLPDAVGGYITTFRFTTCSEQCLMICDTGEVRIKVNAARVVARDSTVTIPNAFTPNGDGKNETFFVENIDLYPQAELIIFNRWGDIFYRAKPYLNTWDGTNERGDPMPEGTYYYILRLNLADGKVYKGDVTILR